MADNPYLASAEAAPSIWTSSTPPCAGLGARFLAYLIDVVPITFATAAVFYLFLGFDETCQLHFSDRGNVDARIAFFAQRKWIRGLSFLLYIIYCAVMEGSALQGTLGKRLLGLRVTDSEGHPLTLGRSFGRNFAKIVSCLPLCIGFIVPTMGLKPSPSGETFRIYQVNG